MNENDFIEITINEDIDQYEAELWKGLSARHIKSGFLVLCSVTGIYILTNYMFLVPPFLAVLISLILSIPIGIWNLIRVEEMDFKTFISRKWKYAFSAPYTYDACLFNDIMEEKAKERKESEKKKHKEKHKGKKEKKSREKRKKESGKGDVENMNNDTGLIQETIDIADQIKPYIDAGKETEPLAMQEHKKGHIVSPVFESAAGESSDMPDERTLEKKEGDLDSLDVFFPDLMESYIKEQDDETGDGSYEPERLSQIFSGMAREAEKGRADSMQTDLSDIFRNPKAKEDKKAPSVSVMPIEGEMSAQGSVTAEAENAKGGTDVYGHLEELINSLKETIASQEETIKTKNELIELQRARIRSLEGGAAI